GSLRHWQCLNALSEKFHNHVSDQSGNEGNHKVVDRENIIHGENQALAVGIRFSKFPHQKV
ncbi:MAG: hypothetical protein WCA19_27235, partial [Candidatus Acidiferrales bacterium]